MAYMQEQLYLYSMLGTMFDTHSKLLAEFLVVFWCLASWKANRIIKVFEK
jgi:hypothetical protein